MAITEDVLVRLRVQGQGQFATAMGGAAQQTGRLGTAAQTTGKRVDVQRARSERRASPVTSVPVVTLIAGHPSPLGASEN